MYEFYNAVGLGSFKETYSFGYLLGESSSPATIKPQYQHHIFPVSLLSILFQADELALHKKAACKFQKYTVFEPSPDGDA